MEINKVFNEQYNFWVISCPEGHMITSWNEGDDILEYTSFEIAYAPKNADLSIYHCITIEEDEKLMNEQLEMIKQQEN